VSTAASNHSNTADSAAMPAQAAALFWVEVNCMWRMKSVKPLKSDQILSVSSSLMLFHL
jgi:hypothetical protein